ncbi:hypothetical protein OESDEN_13864 [Oesophagostomum dentatum]|uniref:Uncharacterized protein n=1 Tax=Oesophagostomum dentatum TaxID=61180 RepID=A0A0B1SN65_OESDE|nr:hypothetical protein OESDEN_13864 [Oesophagostomum dentatum]
MLPNNVNGCRQLYLICNTPPGYATSNMVFNGSPPPAKVGKNVRALAMCWKGMWYFSEEFIEIGTVTCYAAK